MRRERHAVALGQHAEAGGVGALRLRQLVHVGFAQREPVRRAGARGCRRRSGPARSCARCAAAPTAGRRGPEPQMPTGSPSPIASVRSAPSLAEARRARSRPRARACRSSRRRPRRRGPRGRTRRAAGGGCRGRPRCWCRCRGAPWISSPSAMPVASRQAAASAPDVAADERQAVDARLRVDGQPQPACRHAQARGRGAALVERRLGRGAIRHHADRLHVEAEEAGRASWGCPPRPARRSCADPRAGWLMARDR